jgi:hypothetical protein
MKDVLADVWNFANIFMIHGSSKKSSDRRKLRRYWMESRMTELHGLWVMRTFKATAAQLSRSVFRGLDGLGNARKIRMMSYANQCDTWVTDKVELHTINGILVAYFSAKKSAQWPFTILHCCGHQIFLTYALHVCLTECNVGEVISHSLAVCMEWKFCYIKVMRRSTVTKNFGHQFNDW